MHIQLFSPLVAQGKNRSYVTKKLFIYHTCWVCRVVDPKQCDWLKTTTFIEYFQKFSPSTLPFLSFS